jgi:hypothetical protein
MCMRQRGTEPHHRSWKYYGARVHAALASASVGSTVSRPSWPTWANDRKARRLTARTRELPLGHTEGANGRSPRHRGVVENGWLARSPAQAFTHVLGSPYARVGPLAIGPHSSLDGASRDLKRSAIAATLSAITPPASSRRSVASALFARRARSATATCSGCSVDRGLLRAAQNERFVFKSSTPSWRVPPWSLRAKTRAQGGALRCGVRLLGCRAPRRRRPLSTPNLKAACGLGQAHRLCGSELLGG